MNKIWIGIDNGVTGTIGAVTSQGESFFFLVPVKTVQDYTKKKQNISRIDFSKFMEGLKQLIWDTDLVKVIMERPFVNPGGFRASVSGLRAFEAEIIAIEQMGLPYEIVDSKSWQKTFLPEKAKGKELKQCSMEVGIRLFPDLEEKIRKHKDADGLLIAEWARRNNL